MIEPGRASAGDGGRPCPSCDGRATAGQDAKALAARSAAALDRQAATAGRLETAVADSAGAVTTYAIDVHERAREQAEQAALRVEGSRRARTGPAADGTCSCPHRGQTQVHEAARVVTDAGAATVLTSHITELVQHAADVAAASELELVRTAAAARQLLDAYPDSRLVPAE